MEDEEQLGSSWNVSRSSYKEPKCKERPRDFPSYSHGLSWAGLNSERDNTGPSVPHPAPLLGARQSKHLRTICNWYGHSPSLDHKLCLHFFLPLIARGPSRSYQKEVQSSPLGAFSWFIGLFKTLRSISFQPSAPPPCSKPQQPWPHYTKALALIHIPGLRQFSPGGKFKGTSRSSAAELRFVTSRSLLSHTTEFLLGSKNPFSLTSGAYWEWLS